MNVKNPKIKILISSVGSFVGQNILDVLEYTGFSCRHLVKIIGTNSLEDSPNNFRCDTCYKVPNTIAENYKNAMIKVIEDEAPDIILSGRDADTSVLVSIMKENPRLSGILPYGDTISLSIGLNKGKSMHFANRHNLPFAESFVPGLSGDITDLKAFVDKVGYPIVSKPIEGNASIGVVFIRKWDELIPLYMAKTYIFQEYLGNPKELDAYFEKTNGPIPLFAQSPQTIIYSCATIISLKGEFSPILTLENHHQYGITVKCKRVYNAELELIASRFINAYIEEGGVGPISIQFRQDMSRNWKAIEYNLRSNGNTYTRFLMGQDEIGLIIKWLAPSFNFPIYKPIANSYSFRISKTFQTHIMIEDNISSLLNNGKWETKQ